MEITLTLADELVEKIQRLPDPAQFIDNALTEALSKQTHQQSMALSKWAKLARRVDDDPVHLEGYSEQLKADIREFRSHFTLPLDE